MTIHPLIEEVARRLAAKHHASHVVDEEWHRYITDANEAIRVVLTFEPTGDMACAGGEAQTGCIGSWGEPKVVYRAMTAALLKEVENG